MEVLDLGLVPDDPAALRAALQRAIADTVGAATPPDVAALPRFTSVRQSARGRRVIWAIASAR